MSPRRLKILPWVSERPPHDDGEDWSEPQASGDGGGPVVEIEVGAALPSRFLRIEQTGSTDGLYWSIHELDVYGAAAGGG